MPGEPDPANGPTLTCWKEIAQFFGRDVRTVQRWEKEEGLPVHRHLHHRQSSVYARAGELEAWWQERGSRLSEQAPEPRAARSKVWLAWGAAPLILVLLAFLVGLNGRRAATVLATPAFPVVTFDGTRSSALLYPGLSGDLNGDGKADAVFSAPYAHEVYLVFSGGLPSSAGEFPRDANVVIQGRNRTGLHARQIGDFNGDGTPDLLLSEYLLEPDSWKSTGLSYILFGRKQWPHELHLPDHADVVLRTAHAGYTAQTIGCLGSARKANLSAGGVDDVVLGAWEFPRPDEESGGAGAVFILFGRKKWPHEVEVISSADVTIYASRVGETLGRSCAVGDFNGDGYADLAVLAEEKTLWNLRGSRGRAYIFFGRSRWPHQLDAKTDFDFQMQGAHPNTAWAAPVLADVNGDGKDDLILARTAYGDSAQDLGAVHIWFGGKRRGTFAAESADVLVACAAPGERLVPTLTTADVDGDGIADLAVSEPGSGSVYLLYGRREWKSKGRLSEFQPILLFQSRQGAGAAQMGFGDLDGDGLAEILFSDPEANTDKGAQTGRAWVLKPYLPARVDVRPGNEPKVLLYPHDVVVVRVFGDARWQSDPIEPSSVRLAGVPAERYVLRDDNGDGFLDLTLHFITTHLPITPQTTRIALTARTQSGLPVGGSDKVEIVLVKSPATTQKAAPARP